MIIDAQELVCQLLFMGDVPNKLAENWFVVNSYTITVKVDNTRAKAGRVCKLWHKHFLAWFEKGIEAQVKRSWVLGIKMGLSMCNFIDISYLDFLGDDRGHFSLWIKDEPLIVVDFKCRVGKGKNKKGLCELVAQYGILSQYRRLHGVKKTAAKKQAKKIKKKIIGIPNEAYLLLNDRSPEDNNKLIVWKQTVGEEMLDWFREQHALMRAAF